MIEELNTIGFVKMGEVKNKLGFKEPLGFQRRSWVFIGFERKVISRTKRWLE